MSLPEDAVQAWLDAHAAGKHPSPDELCRLCQERVRALVRPRLATFPLVRREEQTTDIANETFMRLLAGLRAVAPPTVQDLNRYLASIIRRVLLDATKALRCRIRPSSLSPGDVPGPIPETDHPVDAELMADFHEYVESLPESEKALFDLIYYCGLSTADAAATLAVPPTTLKRRWARARLRVAERLGLDPTES